MTEGAHAPTSTTSLPFVGVAALVGIVAPVGFALSLVLATWANYDFMRELGFSVTDHGDSAWPSGLAQGPHGWAQIANYALFGTLLLVFFAGLRSEFRRKPSRRVATALLAVLGFGFVLAAFPEDGPPFGDPQTWAGHLHAFGFLGVVFGSMGGMLATAAALRGNERWRGYPALCIAAAAGSFVFLFVLVFALEVATTLGLYGEFAVLLVWIELMAVRLWRVTG